MFLLKWLPSIILIAHFWGKEAEAAFSYWKLSEEELKFFITDEKPPNYSIVNIRSRSREARSTDSVALNPGHLDLTLEDETGKFALELHSSNEIISPNFKLVVRGKDGKIESETTGDPTKGCLYMGSVKGRPDTTAAALATCDGKGFTGVFIDGEHSHLIRPLNASTRSRLKRQVAKGIDDVTEDGLHIIYPHSGKSRCAIHELRAMMAPKMIVELPTENNDSNVWQDFYNQKDTEGRHIISKRQAGKRYTIETAVFTDEAMYQFTKDREGDKNVVKGLESIVLTIMNGVNIIYNAPSMRTKIFVQMIRLEIMKSSKDLIDSGDGDISIYLSNFCIWQHKEKKGLSPSEGWDHGLLLSGIDMWDRIPSEDKVIGLAWVGGMCNSFYSCTINEGTSFEAQFVIAHEMGHNLNMSHDGSLVDGNTCPDDTFLMSPSTGPGKLSWSVCSNRELENFLKSGSESCLENNARENRAYPTPENLPGQVYDIKEQCQYAYGPKFKPYVTSKKPYEAVCRELWCQNQTHALRLHPALEGSTCDQNKYCINGMCQRKLNIPSESSTPDQPSENPAFRPPSDDGQKSSFGFNDFIKSIRNLFHKYFLLSNDAAVFNLPEWRLINTSECTTKCGGGWRVGKVVCVRRDEGTILEDDVCDAQKKPPPKTSCNTFPCVA